MLCCQLQRDISCAECLEECKIKRSPGCIHPCGKKCHPAPCEPCNITTKTACHCGLGQVYYKCWEFYPTDNDDAKLEEDREKRLSCGNRCIKNVIWMNVFGILFFLKLFFSLNYFSIHVDIVVKMFAIRDRAKMKNLVGKN